MKRIPSLTVASIALLAGGCSDQASLTAPIDGNSLAAAADIPGQVIVWNNADAGPGSFRAAIALANADPTFRTVAFQPSLGTIHLSESVVYSGSQEMGIKGNHATIDGSGCGCDAFVANGGGHMQISALTIANAPGVGVGIYLPATRTGTLQVGLLGVRIVGNGLHGVHIDDQVGGATGFDSDAGIRLRMVSTTISGNGFRSGFSDFDGIRVDEGGAGRIWSRISRSQVTGNAGDGIEFDETGDGDVQLITLDLTLDRNGSQPQDPTDLEDGLDIDEAGAGSVNLNLWRTYAIGNFDEGIDIDEDGEGDIVALLVEVDAVGNSDEGIKLSEGGGGSVDFLLHQVDAADNGDDGVQIEEAGTGDLTGRINRSRINDNAGNGVDLAQADSGLGRALLVNVTISGNQGQEVDASGVDVTRVR